MLITNNWQHYQDNAASALQKGDTGKEQRKNGSLASFL